MSWRQPFFFNMHQIINQLILEESLDGRQPVRVEEETATTEMAVTVGDFFLEILVSNKFCWKRNNFTDFFFDLFFLINFIYSIAFECMERINWPLLGTLI